MMDVFFGLVGCFLLVFMSLVVFALFVHLLDIILFNEKMLPWIRWKLGTDKWFKIDDGEK